MTARDILKAESLTELPVAIIEGLGSGIPRIFDEFSKYGLAEPELVDMDGDFRIRNSYTLSLEALINSLGIIVKFPFSFVKVYSLN